EARRGQLPQRRPPLAEGEEVKLQVLSRRDVTEPARVTVRDVGEGVQLRRIEDALRDLDAEHRRVAGLALADLDGERRRVAGLALAVRAAHQTDRPPLVRPDLTGLEFREHVRELV